MPVSVALEPSSLRARPGVAEVCTVTVRNTGATVEEFALSVVGQAGGWAVVDPMHLRLFPGDSGTATVRFTAPQDASVLTGAVPFGVRVVPATDADGAVVEEGVVEVEAFTTLSATIAPRNIEGKSGAHRVTVTNGGNAPIEATIAFEDPDERVAVDVNPARLQVPPGGSAVATVKVRPRAGAPAGRAGYRIIVEAPGSGPIPLDAAITPPRRRKLLPILLPLLVLAAIAVAAFLALRPKVTSAATQIKKINAEIASTKKSIEDGQSALAKAQADAAKAAAVSGEATTTTTAANASTTTTAASSGSDGSTTTAVGGSDTSSTTTSTTTKEVAAALAGEKPFGAASSTATCNSGSSGTSKSSTTTTASSSGSSGSSTTTAKPTTTTSTTSG
ncbi:MAG TPA: hypothetical protein VHN98_07580 [Acidimicrobiales bacterium]|nr:hypothetical protein [Acidimicrobiales bacterium]